MDEWREYRTLNNDAAYEHWVVNHSRRYVDPNDPRKHTQTVEYLGSQKVLQDSDRVKR